MKESKVWQIALDEIEIDPVNPRKSIDEARLKELRDSMQSSGLIQPVTVRPGGAKKYLLVAGQRRFRAAQQLAAAGVDKWGKIAAIVREDLDDKEARSLALIENIHQETMDPLEEAEAVKELKGGMTWPQLSSKLGKAEVYLQRVARCAELSPGMRDGYAARSVSWKVAMLVTRFPELVQEEIADWMREAKPKEARALQEIKHRWTTPLTVFHSFAICETCPQNVSGECYNLSCFVDRTRGTEHTEWLEWDEVFAEAATSPVLRADSVYVLPKDRPGVNLLTPAYRRFLGVKKVPKYEDFVQRAQEQIEQTPVVRRAAVRVPAGVHAPQGVIYLLHLEDVRTCAELVLSRNGQTFKVFANKPASVQLNDRHQAEVEQVKESDAVRRWRETHQALIDRITAKVEASAAEPPGMFWEVVSTMFLARFPEAVKLLKRRRGIQPDEVLAPPLEDQSKARALVVELLLWQLHEDDATNPEDELSEQLLEALLE